ncbi:MAG: hypothetical protein LUG84_07105 [Akkermansiaceae bacterium]|nr:hypothetical protein [Akkermansiaceae bacterium]
MILDHHTANNKNLDYFIAKCREWEARCGQAVAMHILPHDAAQRDKVQGLSFQSHFQKLGLPSRIVPRTTDIWAAIDLTRRLLRYCVFHARCSEPVLVDGIEHISGVNALENYQTAPMGRSGVERKEPLHNACSHAADAFRTFAQAWQAGFISRDLVRRAPLPRGQRRSTAFTRRGLAKGVPWGR